MASVILVAAVSMDGFISRGTGVPWDLPDDRAHFRSVTTRRRLLVGRKTYGEMTGWFGDRIPFVLSTDTCFQPEIGQRVGDPSEALEIAKREGEPLFVIGGGGAYKAAFPLATQLILTRVEDRLETGVAFPELNPDEWHKAGSERHPADARHDHAFSIETWVRRGHETS